MKWKIISNFVAFSEYPNFPRSIDVIGLGIYILGLKTGETWKFINLNS